MADQSMSHLKFQIRKFELSIFHSKRILLIIFGLIIFFAFISWVPALAQPVPEPSATPAADDAPSEAPDKVEIDPTALDYEIRERLEKILLATGWFIDPKVEVQDGVVFLTGYAKNADHRKWAGDLARNTQDVVAVVNQMQVVEPSIWDFSPAFLELREIWRGFIRSLPLVGFSLLALFVTFVVSRLIANATRQTLRKRLPNALIANVASYTVRISTFLVGVFIIFQIAGLTSIATTVIGGTGLLGIVLGIAFRDITENFLASIFLSAQNPFRSGDLVEIDGILGFVEALTTRVTILLTQDGNHVQIPNATVYKSNIYNFTTNPNRRADFIIGIGYDDSISKAQEVALKVLQGHPAVLGEPEPLTLVDTLGSSTVNLRIYFWIDGKEHSFIKVKSAIIRLTKHAFEDAGISMPDEAREVIFPKGIPVQVLSSSLRESEHDTETSKAARSEEPATLSTQAEDNLSSEAKALKEQTRGSWKPGDGENLLPKDEPNDKNKN
jgi:small-conductance mechanosensitive channel